MRRNKKTKGKKEMNKEKELMFWNIIARIIKTYALFRQTCLMTQQWCFLRVGIFFWVWEKRKAKANMSWGRVWRRWKMKKLEGITACLPAFQSTEQTIPPRQGMNQILHAVNKISNMLRTVPSSTFSPHLHPIPLVSSQPEEKRCLVTLIAQ